jgi:hypothetical protein
MAMFPWHIPYFISIVVSFRDFNEGTLKKNIIIIIIIIGSAALGGSWPPREVS